MRYPILIAAILPLSALAGMPSDPPPSVEPSSSAVAHGGHALSSAISASGAIATGGHGGHANAEALGGAGGAATAEQSQSQTQSAAAEASNAGNSQTLNVSSHYEQKRQAPNVYAPAVYASGPCAYGWSAGASIPGGGASFGRAKPDVNCDRRELARVLTPLNPALALKLLCADPLVQDLFRDNPEAAAIECTFVEFPAVVTTTSDASSPESESREPPYVTREELRRAFERSLEK